MSKKLLLVVLLSCASAASHAAGGSNPADTGRKDSNRNYHAYPKFTYPFAGVRPSQQGSSSAPGVRRRAPAAQAAPGIPGVSDPYAFGGWNNLSYDSPALDVPWSPAGPADRVQQPGQ